MVTLEPTFMAKLDQHTPKILSLMASRGGAAKPKIHLIQNMLLQVSIWQVFFSLTFLDILFYKVRRG